MRVRLVHLEDDPGDWVLVALTSRAEGRIKGRGGCGAFAATVFRPAARTLSEPETRICWTGQPYLGTRLKT